MTIADERQRLRFKMNIMGSSGGTRHHPAASLTINRSAEAGNAMRHRGDDARRENLCLRAGASSRLKARIAGDFSREHEQTGRATLHDDLGIRISERQNR